jgi:hypothetical protein
MALKYSPSIVKSGLIQSVDSADKSSYNVLTSVEVLVVAGGGGGGMDIGGGGGGGGVIYNSQYAVSRGQSISVTVGAGGWGAPAGSGGYRGDGVGPQPSSHQFTIGATAGGNSVFGNITALGGGFGASSYFGYTPNYGQGGNGGSGGGASGYSDGNTGRAGSGTSGQGFNGGGSGGQYYSGGGGGAGAPGVTGPSIANGGDGVLISQISPFWFGGGGGGSGHSACCGGNGGKGGGGGGGSWSGTGGVGDTNGINPGVTAANGPYQFGGNAGANTGGGGGGGTHYNYNNGGGNGGSGIVIVRYKGPQAATGGTIETRGGYTYHTFTSSGTFAVVSNNTTWYDTSGNGRHMSLGSSVSYSSDFSGMLTFAQDDNGFARLDPGALDLRSSNFTVISFVRKLSTGNTGRTITAYGNNWLLAHHDSTYGDYYAEGWVNDVGSPPSDNVWRMFTGTGNIASDVYQLYINTSLITSNSAGAQGPYGWNINNQYGQSSHCQIGTLLVYNRVLTSAEITQNYNALKTRYGL